jgi:hypothetical protein
MKAAIENDQTLAAYVDQLLNGGERTVGFALLFFTLNAVDGTTVNYVSNCERRYMIAALKVAEEALEPFAIFAPFIKHKSDDETVLSGHGKRHEWTHLLARHFRDAVAVLEAIRKITGGTE